MLFPLLRTPVLCLNCQLMLIVGWLCCTSAVQGQLGTRSPSAGPSARSIFGSDPREQQDVRGISLAATDEPVVDIRVMGNRTITTQQVLSQLKSRIGRPFDPTLVEADVRNLASKNWFTDIRPSVKKTDAGRIIILQVAERPTVRYVEFLGNRRIRDAKLAKETGINPGGAVDPYAVEEGRRRLVDLYKRNGFSDVQVTVQEGNKTTDNGVTYVIHEGTMQKIWDVDFVGANFVSARRLKTQVNSKPPTLMVFKGFLDPKQLEQDENKLTAYYRSFGFFQARVDSFVEWNDSHTWANVTFVVHEGERYNVRNVAFMGNTLFAEDDLRTAISLPDGVPFEQVKMNEDVNWLKELYGSKGYVFADIRAEPVFLEEPGQIDLVYHIEEGRRWRVGRIFVHIGGENPHTRIQTAINRLSIRTGEIVDIREVRASERRLQASGLFLTDPVQGAAPKITLRIPDLEDVELTAEGQGQGSFRGQSPGQSRVDLSQSHRNTAPTHDQSVSPIATKQVTPSVYEVQRPNIDQSAQPSPSTREAIDVHLYVEPEQAVELQQVDQPRHSAEPLRHTAYKPPLAWGQPNPQPVTPAAAYPAVRPTAYGPPRQQANPYSNLQIRGQSQYPTAGAQPQYGGFQPKATSPETRTIGQGTQQPVSQVQYTEQLPPPAGRGFGAPPVTTIPPGAPVGSTIPGSPPPITPFPQNGPPLAGPDAYLDPPVDIDIQLQEAQTGRFMVGVGVNSDAGVVGQILLDERNFDWRQFPTSWNDFRSGRAFRGGGQRFRLEAAPGTEVQRYLASFTEPYLFDTPLSFGLSGSYYDRRFLDWDERRTGGRVSLGWQWVDRDLSANIAYRGENVFIHGTNISIPELDEMVGHNSLHGFRFTVVNDTRDSAFFPTDGHYLELGVEQVVGSFVYPRATVDARKYFLISERPDHSGRHVISASTRLGFTGNDTPVYDRFFAGGFSTLRGFDFRGASPVNTGVQVGGDFMWVNTVEYLFPLTADDMIHGVVFCDFGTVEEKITVDTLRVAPGFGLRVTVPAMGPAPIALDFAWALDKAATDDTQVFSFNVGFTR